MATYFKVVKVTALPDQPGFFREKVFEAKYGSYSAAKSECDRLKIAESDPNISYRVRTFDF